jgi:hypothetical protein
MSMGETPQERLQMVIVRDTSSDLTNPDKE